MARAYSDDLRRKLLAAYERAEIGLEQLADQFGVSYGYTKKIRRQQLQSGQMERLPQRSHGPASRVTEPVREYVLRQVQLQPDLTAAELKQKLEEGLQVRLSKTRIFVELQRLGLRRKKNPSTRRSKTPTPADNGGSHGGSK
jgi:transposase